MTFWDFCAPIYDFAQKRNINYDKWVGETVKLIRPSDEVLGVAEGTGEITRRATKVAKRVVCTDLSEPMLKVARKKANGIKNIEFATCSIYDTGFDDKSFDVVIASQVLHLIDNPKKAVDELVRVSRGRIILPVCLLKNIRGFAKVQVGLWRLLGFKPKIDFDAKTYENFLTDLGLEITHKTIINGSMPMMVAECCKDQ